MIKEDKKIDRRISVAPMMGWTDRHDRYFLRLISPNALLYTVMITTGALIYGKKFDILAFNPEEHPLALQLGGSDPHDLAESSRIASRYGYDEINLNCGCPSDRVQKGEFGACLMAKPDLVADCVAAMRDATDIPVTVKTRIGIDKEDSYDFLTEFVGKIADKGGCKTFIIHARKAWLNGLSPHENRTVPPLRWDIVHRLKKDFPHLEIILNGGITEYKHIEENMPHVDGIMIGREAYQNPYFLAEIEEKIFGNTMTRERLQVIHDLLPYIDRQIAGGNVKLKDIARHTLGLFHGLRGGKRWRQVLSHQDTYKDEATSDIMRKALEEVA